MEAKQQLANKTEDKQKKFEDKIHKTLVSILSDADCDNDELGFHEPDDCDIASLSVKLAYDDFDYQSHDINIMNIILHRYSMGCDEETKIIQFIYNRCECAVYGV
jgi:hypothetical protein